ncbi:hypothetical protein CPT_Seurat76 [Escherichia phage Seurat]|uniref:Uncharacterized protein n=1 Tax=Escherichia phage Seurat TaxID=1540098 RepID=A0A0A0RQL3_9CAUD|nr:hypothetical protein CPT_Seurat76 [Escherichia phage Seurat]AIW03939.1 hypothetical protein CPT_Seurat76 [Escherichia phage Seurat]
MSAAEVTTFIIAFAVALFLIAKLDLMMG